jgi:hypothetical protein
MTLDHKIVDRARRMIDVRISELRKHTEFTIFMFNSGERLKDINKRIYDQVAAIKSERVGSYHPRPRNLREQHLAKLFEIELNLRIEEGVWSSLRDAHQALGSPHTYGLTSDFKRFIAEYADQQSKDLEEHFNKEAMNFSINQNEICRIIDVILKKYDIVVDMYCDSVSASVLENRGIPSTMHQFYGSVGVVQTGPESLASVIQNLNSDNRSALIDTLNGDKECGICFAEDCR